MRTYIRETINLGKGKRMITAYTPGEYLISNIVKFFLYLFVVWPIQLMLSCFFWMFKIILVSIRSIESGKSAAKPLLLLGPLNVNCPSVKVR